MSTLVLVIGLTAPWIDYKLNGIYIRVYIMASLVVLGVYPIAHWALVTPKVYVDALVSVRLTVLSSSAYC